MALPAITYQLAISSDGNKRTNDPSGIWTPTVNVPTPSNFRITSDTTTTMSLAWDIIDTQDATQIDVQIAQGEGSVQWGNAVSSPLGIGERTAVQAGLTQNTHYRYQIRTTDGSTGQSSPWSVITEGRTEAVPSSGDETDLQAIAYYENFQAGVVGQNLASYSTFELCGNTYASAADPYPNAGSECVETWCPVGVSGAGSWGMSQTTSTPKLSSGGELWTRIAVKYPQNFPLTSNLGWLPFHSFESAALPDYATAGYFNIGIDSVTRNFITTSSWDATEHQWAGQLALGTWQMVEVYALASSTVGKVRLWLDGVPIQLSAGGYELTMQTVESASHFINTLYWHVSWPAPGGPGQAQTHYADEFAYAASGSLATGGSRDDRPVMDTDSNGFSYIGNAVTVVSKPPPIDPPVGGVTQLDRLRYFENFAGVPDGQNPSAYTDSGACSRARGDASMAIPGTAMAISTYVRGDDDGGGWGDWGFEHAGSRFPKMENDGCEHWWRLALFYPSSFSFLSDENSSRIKCMRVNKVTAAGSSDGYVDTHLKHVSEAITITESAGAGDGSWVENGSTFPRDRWFMLECYAKYSTGTSSHRKMWIDGVLKQDYSLNIHNKSYFGIARFLFHTYWNGNPQFGSGSQTQTSWFGQYTHACRGRVDGVYRDDTPYMDTDALGFPIIGNAVK